MIDYMTLRKLHEKTQSGYLRSVNRLTKFLGRSPDTASAEDLRGFQKHLVEHGALSSAINSTIRRLRFFFEVTLERPEVLKRMNPVRVPDRLPVVLGTEEVTRLLNAPPMTLRTDEIIRRFLIHVLPKGFHRIGHYGLFANPVRRDNLTRLRQALPTALNAPREPDDVETPATSSPTFVRRTCGTPLQIVERLGPRGARTAMMFALTDNKTSHLERRWRSVVAPTRVNARVVCSTATELSRKQRSQAPIIASLQSQMLLPVTSSTPSVKQTS